MPEVIIAGAGPRLGLIDRAALPRPAVRRYRQPGRLAALRRLGATGAPDRAGAAIRGMRVTGPRGAVVEGRYPRGLTGRALARRDPDSSLVHQAVVARTAAPLQDRRPGGRLRPAGPAERGGARGPFARPAGSP
ncbi:MAG: hypothetical protein IT176_01510 [Acidobacteria bacterium]|nr:hypothetical protein [Acidobacteriota bacterium]